MCPIFLIQDIAVIVLVAFFPSWFRDICRGWFLVIFSCFFMVGGKLLSVLCEFIDFFDFTFVRFNTFILFIAYRFTLLHVLVLCALILVH